MSSLVLRAAVEVGRCEVVAAEVGGCEVVGF